MAGTNNNIFHLLIFTPGFPSSEEDTTCLPAVQQFILSYQQQFPATKISIITLHYPFTTSHYKWNGVDVYAIGGQNKTGLKRGWIILKSFFKARHVSRKQKVDAVLSFWLTDAALAGKYFSDNAKVPHLIWILGQEAKTGNKYIKWVKPTDNQLAVMSNYQRDVFYKSYGRNVGHVISNALNLNTFPPFNTGERQIDFLAVGSLIPLKQYHLFIEMLYALKQQGYTQIKAVHAGEGVLLEELKHLQQKYGLEDILTFTGNIPHTQILEMMSGSRVFVHPSQYEGHSTVMLEALYSGCYVVSFIPPADTLVENATVCSDFEEMKKACTQLLNQQLAHKQILVSNMADSAIQIHNILKS